MNFGDKNGEDLKILEEADSMTEKIGMDALDIGIVESMSKTISEADVYAFAGKSSTRI